MRIKKIILLIFLAFSSIFYTFSYAALKSIAYHCPKADEIDLKGEIRTLFNEKDIYWQVDSQNISRLNDNATEFVKVILKQKYDQSYDMSVSCIYRTEHNMQLVISPIPSWHFYTDGVAEKTLGNNWIRAETRNLECSKSENDCGFMLR